MFHSTMISRGRRASRVPELRAGDRPGDGVHCGDLPFSEHDGVLSPSPEDPSLPDVPVFLSADPGEQPRCLGEVIPAR